MRLAGRPRLALTDHVHEFDTGKGCCRSPKKHVDWLNGEWRFPGELRLPHAATIIRVRSRAELADRCRFEMRYHISSAALTAKQAAEAVRGHWRIENQAPLGAGRDLQGRPVPPAQRPRREKHGRRQAFGHQSRHQRPRADQTAALEARVGRRAAYDEQQRFAKRDASRIARLVDEGE
jgi:hypothetical protein